MDVAEIKLGNVGVWRSIMVIVDTFRLSPELSMKRPAEAVNKWRLDLLLKERAEHGVKVFVLLYKEVGMALTINSAYTKKILSMQHEKNIQVSGVAFSEACLQLCQAKAKSYSLCRKASSLMLDRALNTPLIFT